MTHTQENTHSYISILYASRSACYRIIERQIYFNVLVGIFFSVNFDRDRMKEPLEQKKKEKEREEEFGAEICTYSE